jgi:phage terminase large subunit-like protein
MEILKQYTVAGMAYDRWRIDDFISAAGRLGLDIWLDDGKTRDARAKVGMRIVPWGQGYKDMAEPVDALEVSILERKLVHDGNPVLTWNISNAMTISDPAGNRKLDKSKTRFRIDGAQALVMALGLKSRDLLQKPKRSKYETEGITMI